MFDEIVLLVVELLVFRPVRVEPGEELHQLLLVLEQDVEDGLGLVGVGYKYLRKGQRSEKIFAKFKARL